MENSGIIKKFNGRLQKRVEENFLSCGADGGGASPDLLEFLSDQYGGFLVSERGGRRLSGCLRQEQKMPFVFLVLSPGWYLMLTVLIFMYHLRCRRYEFLFAGFMILLTLLTVLLGPMALVRYVLILYFAFPVLLPTVLYPERFTDRESERRIHNGFLQ